MISPQNYASNISHGIFVDKSTISKNLHNLKNTSEDQAHCLVKQLLNQPPDLLIVAKDGSLLFNRRLLMLFSRSPVLRDMNIGDSATLLLPECTIHSIHSVLDLIKKGYSTFKFLSFQEYQHILDTAKLLGIEINLKNLENFDVKEKSEVPSEKKKKRKNNFQNEECKTNQKDKKMRFDNLSSKGVLGDKSIKVSKTEEIYFGAEQNKLKIQSKKTSKKTLSPELAKHPDLAKVQSHEFANLKLSKEQLKGFTATKICANSDKMTHKDHKDNFSKDTLNIPVSKGVTTKKCKKSAYQLSYLRKEFNSNQILSTERAELLSKEVFLTQNQIRKWFQCQRSKLKTTEKDEQSTIESMSKIQNGQIIDKYENEKSKLNERVEEEPKVIIDMNMAAELGVPKIKVESQKEMYNCSVCPRSFINKTNLKRHNEKNHEASKERTELIKLLADKISLMKQNFTH